VTHFDSVASSDKLKKKTGKKIRKSLLKSNLILRASEIYWGEVRSTVGSTLKIVRKNGN
jgi:hypothetical protein